MIYKEGIMNHDILVSVGKKCLADKIFQCGRWEEDKLVKSFEFEF